MSQIVYYQLKDYHDEDEWCTIETNFAEEKFVNFVAVLIAERLDSKDFEIFQNQEQTEILHLKFTENGKIYRFGISFDYRKNFKETLLD